MIELISLFDFNLYPHPRKLIVGIYLWQCFSIAFTAKTFGLY